MILDPCQTPSNSFAGSSFAIRHRTCSYESFHPELLSSCAIPTAFSTSYCHSSPHTLCNRYLNISQPSALPFCLRLTHPLRVFVCEAPFSRPSVKNPLRSRLVSAYIDSSPGSCSNIRMLSEALPHLLLLFSLSPATSPATSLPGHIKRANILDATCGDGYTVETSWLDPEVLICCREGYGLGGWGTPVIHRITLSKTKGPICCPGSFNTPEQCNSGDNDQRVRPDNVKNCWFNFQRVEPTAIQGRLVCMDPDAEPPTKRDIIAMLDSADYDLNSGQSTRTVCSFSEGDSDAVPAIGRETSDSINSICCPKEYPQGGWSSENMPVCCKQLDGHMVDCGSKFGYHVPAKHVVNCHGPKNWMTIYGNTTVCEAPAKAPSRPNVIARPKPTGPISRNGSSPEASGHGSSERRAKNAAFDVNSTAFKRSELQELADTTCPKKSWPRSLENSGKQNLHICCVEGFPNPCWMVTSRLVVLETQNKADVWGPDAKIPSLLPAAEMA